LSSTGLSSISWNAAGQPASITPLSGGAIGGTYDALGRLVEINSTGVYTQFVFSPAGAKMAVVQGGALTKATIPLPGGETAVYNASGLNFIRHTDWLGSSRLATTWAHGVYSKEAYAPFGETYNEAGTPDRSFTGQDQDTVAGAGGTGIYDFLFRKYDPSAGRWLSPDPAGWGVVSQADPQSLNRYAHVENQPMNAVDPNGLSCQLSISYEVSDDGSYSMNIDMYDDGDGHGCAAIGVAPSVPTNDITDPGVNYPETVNINENNTVVTYTYYPDNELSAYDASNLSPGVSSAGGVTYSNPGSASSSGTPWYKTCIAKALGSGALSIGLDALGFIPGEKDVEAAVEIGSGSVARQIGNWNGYRGIVADRFGARFIADQSQNVREAAEGGEIGNGAGTGEWLEAGIHAAGLIPGLNDAAAAVSIVYDGIKTAMAVANCP
jgi:RHS repeat-associated protein